MSDIIPCLKEIIYKLENTAPSVWRDKPETFLNKEEAEELGFLVQGAENSKEALLAGLQSLGQMVWAANVNNERKESGVADVSSENLANVGWLIKEVSEILDALNYLASNTRYSLQQNELIKAKTSKQLEARS